MIIAAYRSGLQIDKEVSKADSEKGLLTDLHAGIPVRIMNKIFVDFLFICTLEVALSFDLPVQLYTGSGIDYGINANEFILRCCSRCNQPTRGWRDSTYNRFVNQIQDILGNPRRNGTG